MAGAVENIQRLDNVDFDSSARGPVFDGLDLDDGKYSLGRIG